MTSDDQNKLRGNGSSDPTRILSLHAGRARADALAEPQAAITSLEQLSAFAASLTEVNQRALNHPKKAAASDHEDEPPSSVKMINPALPALRISSLASFGSSSAMALKKPNDEDIEASSATLATAGAPRKMGLVELFVRPDAKKQKPQPE